MMDNVFVIREFEAPQSLEDISVIADESESCLNLWRVQWQQSYLSLDGTKMICHFQAPDAESVRAGLRQAGSKQSLIAWPGTVHEGLSKKEVNVVVEREFNMPTTVDTLQSIEDKDARIVGGFWGDLGRAIP